MEVVAGASLRPSPGGIGKRLSSVDVVLRARVLQRPAARRQPAARRALVVEARRGRSWAERQLEMQRRNAPRLPKIEDDGNPRFVLFIRTAKVDFWYPLNIVTGGTSAKIMLAAKDNFLGKYIYKDALARNLAAVIYKDEDAIIEAATAQNDILEGETEFRYGYKVVENGNLRSALTTSNVIELPRKEELKTVVDKVKDFFGDVAAGAKETFAQITGSAVSKEAEEAEGKKEKYRSKRRKKRKSKQGLKTEK